MNLSEAVVWWRWGTVIRLLLSRWIFSRNQRARVTPGPDYFVASDGSVRRKYPRLHMTKKRRLGMRQPAKLLKWIEDTRVAIEYAQGEIKRKNEAINAVRQGVMSGQSFLQLMDKLREAAA